MRCSSASSVLLSTVLLVLTACGCQTSGSPLRTAVSRFDAGRADETLQQLQLAEDDDDTEQHLIRLDRAVALLMAGKADSAEATLRETRKQLDYLSQKDAKESALSVLTDDKAIAWSGREYERRMVDNLLVVSSLMHDAQDAFAYSTQAMKGAREDHDQFVADSDQNSLATADGIQAVSQTTNDQSNTMDKVEFEKRFQPNAMAAYFQAAVQSELPTNAHVADRAIKQVGFWQSVPTNESASIEERFFGTRTRRGHGALHVVTFVGRTAPWDEERAEPTSSALLIADRILSAVGDHTLPPTVSAVKISRPRHRVSLDSWRTLVSSIDGTDIPDRRAWTLVDLNQAAWDSYQADRDQRLARAVARRVVKKGAVYAAKDHMDVSKSSLTDLLINIGGIAWEAMEKADTRHWHLLPERIEVNQVELPVGDHEVVLASTHTGGTSNLRPVTSSRTSRSGKRSLQIPVQIEDGRNTFLLCFRTNEAFRGSVLVSGLNPQTIPVED